MKHDGVISIEKIAATDTSVLNKGNRVIGPVCGPACGLGACSTCVNYEHRQITAVNALADILKEYEQYIYDSAIDPDGMVIRCTLMFDNKYGLLIDLTHCSSGNIFPQVEMTLILVTNVVTKNYYPLYWPEAAQPVRDTFLNRHPTIGSYNIDDVPFIINEVMEL